MTDPVTMNPEPPITYQIVVTSFPPDEPLPSWCADAKSTKPYKPKTLSYNAYNLVQALSIACLYWVNPTTFTLSALLGATKPILDWKKAKVLPSKDLDGDTNCKDWAKLDYMNKVKVAAQAFLFPFFVAELTAGSMPYFSMGTSALIGFFSATELSQRIILWINPSK